MRRVCAVVVVLLAATAAHAQSIDDLIALKRVTGTPAVSADGRRVAFQVRETNWDDNAYETEIWIADAGTAASARPLTSAKKSSGQPAFSPDGRWIAFVSDRTDTRQLYRLSLDGGEAEALTTGGEGVTAFAWSPDGTRIAFHLSDRRHLRRVPFPSYLGKETTPNELRRGYPGDENERRTLHVVDVITRAVLARPCTTAVSLSPVCS